MTFGISEEFSYFRCFNCGTLNLTAIPRYMSKYYPREYMAHIDRLAPVKLLFSAIIYKLYFRGNKSLVKKFIDDKLGKTNMFSAMQTLLNLSNKKNYNKSTLLDVGTNNGSFLKKLRLLGFKALIGVDPFISSHSHSWGNVSIIKSDVFGIDGQFDYVVMNHSIEHLRDPVRTLVRIRRITKTNSVVMIRTPIVDSYAFNKYRDRWVHLDPPRHISIFTKRSMKIAAELAHFRVVKIDYDSTWESFGLSELCMKGLPLYLNRNHRFSNKQVSMWKALATKLNEERKGDTAVFFLRPSD